MLTSEQAIVVYERGRAIPDRLTRGAHGHYRAYAKKMLSVYRAGIGEIRRELHRSVQGIFAAEPDCGVRRIRAFCKLLDDASEFDSDPRGQASKLRLRVFSLAASFHPLVREPDQLFESGESDVKAMIAERLGRPWPEIESELYADVLDYQKLKTFHGYSDAEALLSRYNVAQLQACLYRCERMAITAAGDFKTILRYAKLARLMHRIRRMGPSRYFIELTGPASVLRETRRYGICFASFVPALLACDRWEMKAVIETPWGGRAWLAVGSDDGLRSHLPPPEVFDSRLEENFARKFGEQREGWTLQREAEILHNGQKVFVPDFVFRHEDGTEVLFEIVGFWTPEYLKDKRQTLQLFRQHNILIAVPIRSAREGATSMPGVILYRTAVTLAPVLEALSKCRSAAQGAQ